MSGAGQRPPVRTALLGLGRSMLGSHVPAILARPDLFAVVAACDPLRERRTLLARDAPKCKMYRQEADMLDEPGIDLVVVSTPSSFHARHAMMALKRGLWTALDTPVALTADEAQILRGQAVKSGGRLLALHAGLFAPEFALAKTAAADPRLGPLHGVRVARGDFVRRDDWQCVKRLGGGAAYYAAPDLVLQAIKLLPSPPVQMWSELKRVASLGDAEDYVRALFRTRDRVSADVEYNGGALPGEGFSGIELHGDRGVFRVAAGAREGTFRAIAPDFKFPRRRSSVRTPSFRDMHEDFPVVEWKTALPEGGKCGAEAMWLAAYAAVRTAAPFPAPVEDALEAVRLAHLMKKTSPYGK